LGTRIKGTVLFLIRTVPFIPFIFSSSGELSSVRLPDSRTIEYINDPLGRRIAKKEKGDEKGE